MTASSVSPAVVLSAPVNPEQETRVCIVAITRHGAAQAAQLAQWRSRLESCKIPQQIV